MVGEMLQLQSPKHGIFPLLQLPRELRDPIYRHSIASGNLGILGVSKLVNEEASLLMPKHGVLRVNLGFDDGENWSQLGSTSVASIPNLELRLSTSPDTLPFDIEVVSGFFDKQIIRKSCAVIIDLGKESSAPFHVHHSTLYHQLTRLGGFQNLLFKLVIQRYEYAEFERIGFSEERFRRLFPYDSKLLSYHSESYLRVQTFLEIKLGPAKLDVSVEGHCLEFHPLEPWPQGWEPALLNAD